MIGSLFIAALFSACASALQLTRAANSTSLWWFGASLFIAIVIGMAMRKLRRSEVDYVYLNFLIAHAARQLASTPAVVTERD